MHPLWWLPINLCNFVMRSNNDIDWPAHALMLSLHDLRGFHLRRHLSPAYHDDIHCRTTITCDTWRLTVKASDVWRGYWNVTIHIRWFCALCMTCQASSCSIIFSKAWIRLSRSTVNVGRHYHGLMQGITTNDTQNVYRDFQVERHSVSPGPTNWWASCLKKYL